MAQKWYCSSKNPIDDIFYIFCLYFPSVHKVLGVEGRWWDGAETKGTISSGDEQGRVEGVYSVQCVLCSTVLPGGSTVYTPTNFPDIFGHKLQSQLQLYTFVAPHRTQSRDWRYFTRFIWVKTRKRPDGPTRMRRIYNVSFWAVLCCMRASHVTTLCYVKV